METKAWIAAPTMILLAIAIGGCGGPTEEKSSEATPVLVLAAASTTNAVEEIAAAFEREHKIPVAVSTGPSNGLARQILAGAPADVFVSANPKWADAVNEAGLATESAPLLTNEIVLIVPKGNPAAVESVEDLLNERVSKIALAGEEVPAGMYAEQSLRATGHFDALVKSGKIARGQDVRVTLGYIERGEAEAGVVYRTDAGVSDAVEIITALDPTTYDPVVYPAVLLSDGENPTDGAAFHEFLRSDQAAEIFAKWGFKAVE